MTGLACRHADIAFAIALFLAAASCLRASVVVDTDDGPVRGFRNGSIVQFLGIPYAAPPLGEKRWAEPVRPDKWGPEPFNASTLPPSCPQSCMPEVPAVCDAPQDENCLFLNVFAPDPSHSSESLPVIIFWPGGNYRKEGTGLLFYQGENIANFTNTVVVTANYRIGALGFLVTPNLRGNYGIKDQRLTLQWVQRNIRGFGGDPSRVTIWGQSAGAGSVAAHIVSPLSKGLFERGFIDSNPFAIEYKGLEAGIKEGQRFAELLNCSVSDIKCLRGISQEAIVYAQEHSSKGAWPQTFEHAYPWSPSVESEDLPDQPLAMIMNGNFTPVPTYVGTNLEEGIQFVYALITDPIPEALYEDMANAIFYGHGKEIVQAYPVPPEQSKDVRPTLCVIATHYTFSCATRMAARKMAEKAPTFLYYFDHPLSFDPWGPFFTFCEGHVCHGADLPSYFRNLVDPRVGFNFTFTPPEDELSQTMLGYLKAFAYGEDKELPGRVNWPAYNRSDDNNIRFDTGSGLQMQSGRLQDKCDLWDKIGYLKY